jgi:hypothetical protein
MSPPPPYMTQPAYPKPYFWMAVFSLRGHLSINVKGDLQDATMWPDAGSVIALRMNSCDALKV